MKRSPLLISTMLVGTAILTSCKSRGPSNEDSAASATQPSATQVPAAGVAAVSDTPSTAKIFTAAWPNVDFVILQDYSAYRGRDALHIFRIHMDIVLGSSNTAALEGHLNSHNGYGFLNAIWADLTGANNPVAWRTLKASLRCTDATLVLQTRQCTRRPGMINAITQPISEVIVMKDWPGPHSAMSAVRLHTDLVLRAGKTTADAIASEIEAGRPKAALRILASDGAITKDVGDPAGWATLKAALGCTQYYDRDPANCD